MTIFLIPPENNYITIFNLHVYYYSFCIFLGFIFSLFALQSIIFVSKSKVNSRFIFDKLLIPVYIGGILGARVYYVLLSWDFYSKHSLEIFMINHGGLSIHGAILGGIIAGFILLKKYKKRFLPYADVVSTVLPLGQAIGRWGNFFNSEAFGKPFFLGDNPVFALYVPPEYRPYLFREYDFFHPCFLYESIFDFIIFLILFCILKKTANKINGFVFGLYIILYSIVRSIVELIRLDSTNYIFNMSLPFVVSIVSIFTGVTVCFAALKQSLFNHGSARNFRRFFNSH